LETSQVNIEYILNKTKELSKVEKGTLYLVSSPIGNIEDISFRAIYILNSVNMILAEDTRVTGFLLKKYGIKNKVLSYFSRIENDKLDFVIENLKTGNAIALISDSGTPLISDPGSRLVSKCIEEGIKVMSVPGANAIMQSLVMSGVNSNNFYFQGFIPVKKSRNKTFEEFTKIKMPILIYESKYRIYHTLRDILTHLGNVEVIISRELTKKFEQVINGKVKEILNNKNFISKGEFTIIINRV
jgi:16S rRNA (cytidine1402-2'-O)-methyltransferase